MKEFKFNPITGTMEPANNVNDTTAQKKPVNIDRQPQKPKKVEDNVDIVGDSATSSANINTNERTVQFRVGSDRKVINIMDEKTHEILCCISGYDLHWAFNLKELRSVARVEQCLDGLTKLFRNQITEAMAKAIKG